MMKIIVDEDDNGCWRWWRLMMLILVMMILQVLLTIFEVDVYDGVACVAN